MAVSVRKIPPGTWFAAASLLVALVWLIRVVPYTIGYGFSASPLGHSVWIFWHAFEGDWTHGMFVPAVTLFLIWRDRKLLAALEDRPAPWGILVILFGLLCFWLGLKADVIYLGYAAVQILLAGAVLWFFGWQHLKLLTFPLLFLTFTWPLLFLDNMIAFPLRMVMSETTFHFLNLIGLDTVKVGTAVVSAANPAAGLAQGERFAVDIADPCSGIRSLFALLMVSCLYGHLMLRSPLQKLTLFLMAFPLAVLGNFVRILMLTFGTLMFGSDFAIGTLENPSGFHLTAGFIVFVVAIVGMLQCTKLLKLLPPSIANLLGKGADRSFA